MRGGGLLLAAGQIRETGYNEVQRCRVLVARSDKKITE